MSAVRKLDAALPLYLEVDSRIPLVSVSLLFRTGGMADPIGKDGLARLTLRALREGTERLDALAFETALDSLGAELSADVYTTSSAIHAQVLSRNVEGLFDLLGEMLATPRFPAEGLERVKRETVAELEETRDNDRELANLALRRKLFQDHAYGRLAIGRLSTIPTLERADVLGAHARLVRRENVVVGITGDITEARARALTEALSRAFHARTHAAETGLTLTEPQMPRGRHLVFVDKPERTQTQVLIGRLGTWAHDPDHMPLIVANAAFGGTFTARLMKEIRSKRGWSYGASSRLAIERVRHSFSMWTFPARETTRECVELELKMLEEFHDKGISERERSFFTKYLTRSYAFEVDTAQKRMAQALDVEALQLPNDYYATYLERLAGVTTAAACDAVRQRLDPRDLCVSVVGTQSDLLESLEDLITFDSVTVVPFDAD
jgi:zinc protease